MYRSVDRIDFNSRNDVEAGLLELETSAHRHLKIDR